MKEKLATKAAHLLHEVIEKLNVGDAFTVLPSADICYCLELIIPDILREKFPEWEHESLDGIIVAKGEKKSPNSANLFGICVLISDQTVTPFSFDLEIKGDSIKSAFVKVGEPGVGLLGISGPPVNSKDAKILLERLPSRIQKLNWSYQVEVNQQI